MNLLRPMTEEVEELKKEIKALKEIVTEVKEEIESLETKLDDKLNSEDLEWDLRMLGITGQRGVISILCKRLDEIMDNPCMIRVSGLSIKERLLVDAYKKKPKRR